MICSRSNSRLTDRRSPLSRCTALPHCSNRQCQPSSLFCQREKTAARYCMPQGTTKVCPVCLAEEPEAYERLYWNLRSVLICPRHLVFLIDRCPSCNCLIPTQVRSSITDCPYCHSGDYRAAVPATLAQDSLLCKGQQMLLRFLGVEETSSREISQPFHGSPLAGLSPWQYFDLLDHFRVVAPYLRP